METRRLNEKNRIRIRIREITNYIEKDNTTIERLRIAQNNKEFNRSQVEKLTIKNEERKCLIKELNERSEKLENGELDKELEDEYKAVQKEIKRKDNEAQRKKKEIIDNKKEEKKRLDEMWKITKQFDRENRWSEKDLVREERYFNKINDSIPDYILRSLKEMPNNKGYIWKGIYCFGELPSERNSDIIVMFEKKPRGVLRIHEWSKNMIKIYEKQGKNKRYLISEEYRKPNNSIASWTC